MLAALGDLSTHPVGASVFPFPGKGLCAFRGPIISCSLDLVCMLGVSSARLQPQLSLAFPNSNPKKGIPPWLSTSTTRPLGIPPAYLPVQPDLCKYKWLRKDVFWAHHTHIQGQVRVPWIALTNPRKLFSVSDHPHEVQVHTPTFPGLSSCK